MFVEQICDFKNKNDCHVFLITHSRKGENENKPTGKMDVRGSAAITDLADTVLTIWRNKDKEAKLQNSEKLSDPDMADALGEPDGVLFCNKQRNGEWEGQRLLFWDNISNQFLQEKGEMPAKYSKSA